MMDHRDVELPVRVSLRAIMSKTQPNHCSHLHIVFVREALPEVTEQVIGTARGRLTCANIMALFLLTAAATGATELTPDNWDKEIKNRAAFIKFLAPW
jgi:hypothetical protein